MPASWVEASWVEELLAVVPTQEALAAPKLGAQAWRVRVAMPEAVAPKGIERGPAEERPPLRMAD